MTRIYIAGPMSGLPELNYPAFNAMAERRQQHGLSHHQSEGVQLPVCAPRCVQAGRSGAAGACSSLNTGWIDRLLGGMTGRCRVLIKYFYLCKKACAYSN